MADFDMKILEGKPAITRERRYEVRPLECWAKMKELRRNQVKRLWNAKKEGRVLILGLVNDISSITRGLGDVSMFTFGPYFGKIMDTPELAIKCCEATEAQGFGPDTCATLRIQLGSILMGFHNKGRDGSEVVPDFCLEIHNCEAQSKIAKEMSEHYGIPMFSVDMPPFPDAQDYLVSQMFDAIEWMQKVTKRSYDDERLIEGVYNEWRTRVYYARICELMKNIPSPIDLRMLASFNISVQVAKSSNPEVAELMKMLYEECQERIKLGVSALGIERARLFHEGMFQQYAYAGWPQGGLSRQVAPYGAIFLGSRIQYALYGAWKIRPDNTWEAAQTLEEQGIVLRSREDALRALAELYCTHSPQQQMWTLAKRVPWELATTRDWNIDGVVFCLDRTCHGLTPALLECRAALQKAGIPSMVYEASAADPREFHREKVVDTLESFLEQMGLTKTA